jgi:peptide-methionine (S)-S-oxide reductase
VGYAGGDKEDPTYEDVCTGQTGHAEVVRLQFDPDVVSYEGLLEVLWDSHDPTTMDSQGPDRGTQYRSVIFYHDEAQRAAAEASKAALDASGKFSRAVVTTLEPAGSYYAAEDYHQKYLEKQGQSACPA